MKKNPFKILLSEPKRFANQRKPGERPKKEMAKTEFSICFCQNRHPFFAKGRQADRKLKCPDPWCDAMVDNTDFVTQATGANAAAQIIDNSKKDEKQSKDISPIIRALLQLLGYLTMLLGHTDTSGKQVSSLWKETKDKFLLLSKVVMMKEEPLCVALHEWLCGLPQWFNKTFPNELDNVDSQSIEKFERAVEKDYSQFFNKFKNSSSLRKVLSASDSTREIDYKIKEEDDATSQPILQLFLVTRIVSFTSVLYKFYNNPELTRQYPLLFHTLKLINDLEYVKCLPGIGQWTKYCHLQFSGRLRQEECKVRTIDSIINDCDHTKYKQFWKQLVKCWERFKERTQDFQTVYLDCCTLRIDTPGKLIVEIAEILQEINNNFLQSAHSYCKKVSIREEQKMEDDDILLTTEPVSADKMIISKSLFEISNRDIVCIDKAMVNKIISAWHCPTLECGHDYDDDSNERIDFQSIESEIYNRAILGRHVIDISIPMFQYADELTVESHLESLELRYPDLKNHISTPDEWENIQSIFSDPQDKRDAAQILCQVIVLLNRADKINLLAHLYKSIIFLLHKNKKY
ncbi:hypothetical protein RFI_31559 [Reticulomyxa filosa]|uniref:Uncharacterized protein n=1 Tax=Reticulomyxa filosa TaxID=46433 RepID=X6LW36_RETFI|nr:hypothetical protein RFI_31559 [Reticulomyxa filosa]|eukprot:ETO05834.1 hypothetical protein RFI_31559 [Reticulomyxa filosa]